MRIFRRDDFEAANNPPRMLTRRAFIGLLASAGALGLGGCSTWPRTVRYRMTLDVQTPEGVRTGSGVIQVRTEFNNGALKGIGHAVHDETKGEAVVVDLGPPGLLFCLLTGDPTRHGSPSAENIVDASFPDPRPRDFTEDSGKSLARYYDDLNARLPKADVPLERLPMLVRFRDIADPKTVERVDPYDLAKSFGPGVKLSRATIEITDDAVTTGIEKRLAWLGEYPEPSLAPVSDPFRDPAHPPFAATVHHGDFRRGLQ